MSTRTSLRPEVVINAASMAANITSSPTILQSLTFGTYQVTWSGSTPVGTISLQASDDYSLYPDGTVNNTGTWSTLTLQYNGSAVTTIPVSGNSGNGLIEWETGAYAIRLIYTAGSGTGTMSATVVAKVK